MPRHILGVNDIKDEELDFLVAENDSFLPTEDAKRIALLFCSASTRSRMSFVQAIDELGHKVTALGPQDLRLSDGESIADTAQALSTYVHLIGIRTMSANSLLNPPLERDAASLFAEASSVPVINLADDLAHPCQALADAKTLRETIPRDSGKTVVISWAYSPTWLRPVSIMNDLSTLVPRAGYNTVLAHPPEFALADTVIDQAHEEARSRGLSFRVEHDLRALEDDPTVEVVYGRNWTSSNYDITESEAEKDLHRRYSDWSFDEERLDRLNKNAFFMHCLPAHRGYEVSNEVIDGPRSLVDAQMRNRVPVQRNLIKLLLGD